jgi:hypothetical protein
VGVLSLWTRLSDSRIFNSALRTVHSGGAGTRPQDFTGGTKPADQSSRHEPIQGSKERGLKTARPTPASASQGSNYPPAHTSSEATGISCSTQRRSDRFPFLQSLLALSKVKKRHRKRHGIKTWHRGVLVVSAFPRSGNREASSGKRPATAAATVSFLGTNALFTRSGVISSTFTPLLRTACLIASSSC